MKNAHTHFLVLLLLVFGKSFSQDADYQFGYLFKKKILNQGTLFQIIKKDSSFTKTIGSFVFNDNKTYSINTPEKVEKKIYIKRDIENWAKGIITKYSNDSIYIKFWRFKGATSQNNKDVNMTFLDSTNTGDTINYVYHIKKWGNYKKRSTDIPFRFWQFMATSIPFRSFTKTGKLEGDFLNANATFVKVSGHTRFYKSSFVKPRNRYFAYGPFLGLSTIENPVTSKDEFGLNYGVNIIGSIHGLNIIAAYGFENGFKSETNSVNPYFGFGIGFKLLDTFNPEIKTGD